MRCLRALAAPLLASLLVTGCFVFDELDNANKTAVQLSRSQRPAGSPAPEEPQEPVAEDEGPGILARLEGWWARRSAQPKAAPPRRREPEDVPVRCQVDGSVLFTHRFDCLARGGRPLD